MSYKIWICGITQNQRSAIEPLVNDEVMRHVDGLVFVDSRSTDGTYELLESKKGAGKIISRDWVYRHDHSMNEYLFAGVMQEGDWFFLRDSTERLHPDFLASARDLIATLELNNVDCAYQYSKALLAKYSERLFFRGNPHWGLQGCSKAIQLKDFEKFANDETYAWSDRHKVRKYPEHRIDSEYRYYVYPNTNQVYCVYQSNPKKWQEQELVRLEFLKYCRDFNVPILLNDFVKHLTGNPSPELLSIMRKEKMLWNVYRLYILKEDANLVEKEGDGWNNKTA